MMCHILGLSSSDMQRLRQDALTFYSGNLLLVGQNLISHKFNFNNPTHFNMKMPTSGDLI